MKAPSENLVLSLVQAELAWMDKRANLQMFEDLLLSHKEKMEVVVLPEMFSTGFIMDPGPHAEKMDGSTVQWMQKISEKRKVVIAGSIIIEEDGNFFNRLIWMLPDGSSGYYDKRHLFAYAGENEHFTAGKKRLISSVKGWKLNLQVCYDLRFPLWARQAVPFDPPVEGGFAINKSEDRPPEYDVLIYVANWPQKRAHAWKTLLQARAIENQCYVAGTNRIGTDGEGLEFNGDSMIVDPMGEIIETVSGKAEIITTQLSYSKLREVRHRLPFLKDADPFILAH